MALRQLSSVGSATTLSYTSKGKSVCDSSDCKVCNEVSRSAWDGGSLEYRLHGAKLR